MTTSTLTLSAPVNLRNLAGIPIDGGTVQPNLAIRSDDLATIPDDVAADLVDRGLAAVIDLRSPLEVAATGRGPLAEYPVAYHHLPLIARVADSVDSDGTAEFTHESMGVMYQRMVDNAAPQLVTALNIIAYTPGPVAFHCAAGRDRTGVLAAVLLLTLGASDDDIVRDYSRTGDNMRAILDRIAPTMSAMWQALNITAPAHDGSALVDGSMDVSMRMLLTALRGEHGDALAPLRAAGLSADTITRLRERALTP